MPVLTRSRAKKLDIHIDPIELNTCPIKKKSKVTKNVSKVSPAMHASTKLVSRNTEAVPSRSIKRKLSSSSQQNGNEMKKQQVANDDVEEGISIMRKIKLMLERNFKNIAERLHLDPIPACLYDLKTCHLNHHPKNTVPSSIAIYSLSYLDEDHYFQFLHRVRHRICAHSQFPGSEVMIKTLESMLKLPNVLPNNLTVTFILKEFHNLFRSVLHQFPPCHLRQQYIQILTLPFKVEGIREKKPLLTTVLNLINDLIFIEDISTKEVKKKSMDIGKNFYMMEQKMLDSISFNKLPRSDKFERLFLILDLVVQILEYDASIFIIKYSHKFASSIAKDKIKPLVCFAIWQNFESVISISSMIKQIISIFIAMVALEYPKDKIQIISRLLTLISHIINIYEYTDDTFEYPTYKHYSLTFAREIQRSIENSSYYNMNLYLNVISSVRSPLIRMLLTNFLYTKINNVESKPSLTVPFNAIKRGDFESFSGIPTAKHLRGTEKFPKYDEKKKVKSCTIVQSDFLRLLLIYAESVNSYYRISSAVAEIQKTDSTPHSSPKQEKIIPAKAFDEQEFLKAIENVDLNEKVCLREIDLNFKKMVHIRLTKDTCCFYRDEIKHFYLLNKLIKHCYESNNDGGRFDDWLKFIKNLESDTN